MREKKWKMTLPCTWLRRVGKEDALWMCNHLCSMRRCNETQSKNDPTRYVSCLLLSTMAPLTGLAHQQFKRSIDTTVILDKILMFSRSPDIHHSLLPSPS